MFDILKQCYMVNRITDAHMFDEEAFALYTSETTNLEIDMGGGVDDEQYDEVKEELNELEAMEDGVYPYPD